MVSSMSDQQLVFQLEQVGIRRVAFERHVDERELVAVGLSSASDMVAAFRRCRTIKEKQVSKQYNQGTFSAITSVPYLIPPYMDLEGHILQPRSGLWSQRITSFIRIGCMIRVYLYLRSACMGSPIRLANELLDPVIKAGDAFSENAPLFPTEKPGPLKTLSRDSTLHYTGRLIVRSSSARRSSSQRQDLASSGRAGQETFLEAGTKQQIGDPRRSLKRDRRGRMATMPARSRSAYRAWAVEVPPPGEDPAVQRFRLS